MICLDWKSFYDYWEIIASISGIVIILGLLKREAIKRAVAYCKDFCTYKKRYNVFIDFSEPDKINGYDDRFKFKLYIKNNTYSHIRIDRIEIDRGSISLLVFYPNLLKSGKFKKGFFIEFDRTKDINGLYLQPSGYKDDSDSRSNFEIFFVGNKRPKLVLKYRIVDTDSKNNQRKSMSRVIPIQSLER